MPKPGQTWERKDTRDGGVQVLIWSADEHFVIVLGKRRSRIRAERFPRDYRLVQDVSDA